MVSNLSNFDNLSGEVGGNSSDVSSFNVVLFEDVQDMSVDVAGMSGLLHSN